MLLRSDYHAGVVLLRRDHAGAVKGVVASECVVVLPARPCRNSGTPVWSRRSSFGVAVLWHVMPKHCYSGATVPVWHCSGMAAPEHYCSGMVTPE